jgi:hypothetical protein
MNSAATYSVTLPTDRKILLTREFDAPRAAVFEAWTKAEHVKHRERQVFAVMSVSVTT